MKGSTEVTFCGVSFRNPIVVASTDIGRSEASFEAFARAGVGGIITKSVTDAAPLQKAGITMFDIRDMKQIPVRGEIPGQYYFFSRGGAMIAMEDFLPLAERELKLAQDHGVVLIGSISASKVENWVAYAKAFEESLKLRCPPGRPAAAMPRPGGCCGSKRAGCGNTSCGIA